MAKSKDKKKLTWYKRIRKTHIGISNAELAKRWKSINAENKKPEEVKVEVKVETAKVEIKPVTIPEVVEVKVETKEEPKVEVKPEPKVEMVAEVKVEAKPAT